MRKTLSLERKQQRIGILFLLPLLLGIVFIFIPNLVKTFVFTLNNIEIVSDGYRLDYVGLKNYVELFTQEDTFRRQLLSSMRTLVTETPVLVIFSLFIATVLNQNFSGRMLARAIFFVPVILATGVIMRIESSTDLLNFIESGRTLKTGSSLDNVTVSLFDMQEMLSSLHFNETLIGIVTGAANSISHIIMSSGMQIFILLAGLQEIPQSLYEAAHTEGCSAWEAFWKITFPMISPQIVVCLVYTVVNTFTDANNPLFLYINQISSYGVSQYGFATAMYMVTLASIAVILIMGCLGLRKYMRYTEQADF